MDSTYWGYHTSSWDMLYETFGKLKNKNVPEN